MGPDPFCLTHRVKRRGTAAIVSLAALLAGCGSCVESGTPDENEARVAGEQGCSAAVWGVVEVDRLVSIGGDAPLVYEASVDRLLASERLPQLVDALTGVTGADLSAMPLHARATLQHDLWGLRARVGDSPSSSEARAALHEAASTAAAHVALAPEAFAELPPRDADEVLARHLPAADGWEERGSEMPVLGHERAFGLRRIFRVFERPGGRALASQLVSLDRGGAPHLIPVIGEVEVLALDGDTVRGDRVLHLDRRSLRCAGPAEALHEVATVAHIPGVGADSFLVELDPPAQVADNPCARCHEDAFAMSLPSASIDPRARERRLLAQLAELLAE